MRGVVLRVIVLGFVFLSLGAPGRAQNQEHDWPEWRGRGRRGVWTETGILETFPDSGLKAAWRTPIRSGYAGPAVADGRVFVSDAYFPDPKRTRAVERALALDERTGEILWTHEWETDYAGISPKSCSGPTVASACHRPQGSSATCSRGRTAAWREARLRGYTPGLGPSGPA